MDHKPRIVAIIEARMTSTRLPGKVMLPAAGRPMLEHVINRVRRVPSIEGIVLATTTNSTDDCLVELADRLEILCFRGSENDVMQRVIGAAEMAKAEVVVEITGDCPVIDPLIVEQNVRMFLYNDCDYVCNGHIPSYPGGMGSQVYRLETLKKSSSMTDKAEDREHVTLHIRKNPQLFRHIYLIAPPDLCCPELNVMLDEPEDYELLKKIIEHFDGSNAEFGCREILQLMGEQPDWFRSVMKLERTKIKSLMGIPRVSNR